MIAAGVVGWLAAACGVPVTTAPRAEAATSPALAKAGRARARPLDRARIAAPRSVSFHPILSTDVRDGDDRCGGVVVGAELVLGEQEAAVAVGDVARCEAFLQERHRATVLRAGVVGHPLWVSDVAVTSDVGTIAGARGRCAEAMEGACRSDFLDVSWTVQSIVGPIVSVTIFHEHAGGGGPPSGGERWRTVDLRSGRPAALDALVTEPSLIAALAASPEIAEVLDEEERAELHAARSLADVLAIHGLRPLSDEGASGYAFADAGPGGDARAVTMLLGVRWEWTGRSLPDIEPIALRVVPRPEAAPWFSAAERGEGLLVER